MTTVHNLFDPTPPDDNCGEVLESLLTRPGLRLERIISRGCPSPDGWWYDQPHDEWVMLAAGSAVLEIEGRDAVALALGDHLVLPARLRHRVARVSTDAVWLALHLAPGAS
jgi:cupin 2 domain-containing protein